MWISSACILLWLSLEQIIKILVIQKRISSWEIDIEDKNLNDIHKIFDKEARKLTKWKTHHCIDKLIDNFEATYQSFKIGNYKNQLIKVNEYFERRYVKRGWTSINISLLYDIDKLYFNLRDFIDSKVPQWTIDEIFIRKQLNYQQIEEVSNYAFHDNKNFRPRRNQVNISYFIPWKNGEITKTFNTKEIIDKFYESNNLL